MKSLQAFILHLIIIASVHFVTLISTPCFCPARQKLLHRSHYRGVLGVNGCHGADVTNCLTVFHYPNQSVVYEGAGPRPKWDQWNSNITKTNSFHSASSNHCESNESKFSPPDFSDSAGGLRKLSDNYNYRTCSVQFGKNKVSFLDFFFLSLMRRAQI